MRHLVLFVALFAFWIMLSGQVDITQVHQRYLLACGLLSAGFGTWLAHRIGFLRNETHVGRILLRQYKYLPWLMWQVVLSNFDVMKRVWSRDPRANISPKFLRVPYETESDLATVLYANSITLTPGTVTVSIDTDTKEILVYALSDSSSAGLKDMHDRVRALETDK